jgi:2-iminobutanoate/2-iminopropanoate deaminase
MKKVVKTDSVFNPEKMSLLGSKSLPWSHAVKASGTYLFVSGQTPTDIDGNTLWKGDILKQTEAALENLKKVVEEAGLTLDNVVQLMWFVTDADKFYSQGASDLRREYFRKDYPTSTLIQVMRLANPDAMIEVQAVAAYD